MSAERAESESVVIHLTARLLARVAQVDPQVLREALPATLPWMRFLPKSDADAMSDEFIAAAEAGTALGDFGPVARPIDG
ncbi:hypothetical protein [Antribacter gilvus]|uniref:hypothetical protein n=1 Tax=Antribacter gilvus TaxID=2304675 RepID=UPI000F7B14BA|nr:hypothetical protein [Antribacter gilvus]